MYIIKVMLNKKRLLSGAKKLFVVLSTIIIVSTPQASAMTPQDFSCVTDGGTCHYDPTEQCSNTGGGAAASSGPASSITGDLKSLAQQILDNHSITFDFGPSGPTGTQFKRLANGQKAQTDDGRQVDVQPIVLVTILHLAQGHTVNVSALTDGSSHTAPTNPHGSGNAVDINIFDGSHNNGSDAVANKIINLAAEVLPSGSRFGMGNNPFGNKQIGGKTFKSFADHPDHVHIDVLGVSQADKDAAVQAAGGGAPVASPTPVGVATPGGAQAQGPVYILGDSITVRAQDAYQAAFQEKGATVSIDGSSSRSLTAPGLDGNRLSGLDAIDHDADTIRQASAIVIALGTNGGTTSVNIRQAIKAIKALNATAPIYWIDTISVGRSDNLNGDRLGPANRAINGLSQSLGYQVISWFKAVDSDGDPLHPTQAERDPNSYIVNGDEHVHPTPAGSTALAELVANTVDVSAVTSGTGTTSCCPGGGSTGTPGTALTGDGPGEQVFNFFAITHHLSNDAAAAATGNLQLESANWSAIDAWGGGGGNYYGIAQWSRNDRYVDLVNFSGGAANAAKLNYQLDFIWHELSSPAYKAVLQNLKSSSSLEDKTIYWGRHYEVAITNGALQMQAGRIAYAVIWARKAGGGGGSTPAPAATTADTSCTAGAAAGPPGEYRNPFHDMSNVGPSRIDEGADYFATTGTVPVYAIGNGEITLATANSTFFRSPTSGHADWITYRLSDGPAAGKYIYVSESCTIDPDILSGTVKTVSSNTKLCDMLPSSIEMGWADSPTNQVAAAYASYQGHHGWKTAYGVNFDELIVSLGGPHDHLGSGVPNQVTGTLPDGWPTW